MKLSTPLSVCSMTSSRPSAPEWRESTDSSLPRVRDGREKEEAGQERVPVGEDTMTEEGEEGSGEAMEVTEAALRICEETGASKDMAVTTI